MTEDKPKWHSDVQIDMDRLSDCMAEQPGLYAYYASLAAHASHELSETKSSLAMLEAEVEREIRTRYRALGEKITVKEVEASVSLDSRVQTARKKVRDCKLEYDLCKVAAEAFSQRLQAMITIGAQQRTEIKSLNVSVASEGDWKTR